MEERGQWKNEVVYQDTNFSYCFHILLYNSFHLKK